MANEEHHDLRSLGVLSSNLLAIEGIANHRIDWETLWCILAIGEPFGDLTPFEGLKFGIGRTVFAGLDPGAEGNLAAHFPPCSGITLDDACKRYNELLLEALDSLPADAELVMGLSGGRDSRHILLALRRLGRTPRLVTARHFHARLSEADVTVAQALAARLGIDIVTVEQPRDRFQAEWDKNRLTGLQTIHHSWGLALAEALNGPETLLDGMNGGVLFGRSDLQRRIIKQFGPERPSFTALLDAVTEILIDRPSRDMQTWLEGRILSAETRANARERLRECFAQYRNFPNPIQAFLYFEHVRRNSTLFTYGLMKNRRVFCPLATPAMVGFALSLPWEISTDEHFQDKATRSAFPDFADLPYTEAAVLGTIAAGTDPVSESRSWQRLRALLEPHLGPVGLDLLDHTRDQFMAIRRSALLAQATCWENRTVSLLT